MEIRAKVNNLYGLKQKLQETRLFPQYFVHYCESSYARYLLIFSPMNLPSIYPYPVCVLWVGGPHESRILAGYYGFSANISFTFQAIKNLYAHPRDLCFGPFCKFFGDF